jgi:hypothetical protein
MSEQESDQPAPAPALPLAAAAPDVWAAWVETMPDAALPETMPAGFTPAAGWRGLHTQRARADAARAQLEAAAGRAEAAETEAAGLRERLELTAIESYLAGKGATPSPRAQRFLLEEYRKDQAGTEAPVSFAEWAASDAVTGDPWLSRAFGREGTAPAAPAPNPAAGQVPGGTPSIQNLATLDARQVADMIKAGEVTQAEYLRQMNSRRG